MCQAIEEIKVAENGEEIRPERSAMTLSKELETEAKMKVHNL